MCFYFYFFVFDNTKQFSWSIKHNISYLVYVYLIGILGADSIPLDASIISARPAGNLHCRKLRLQHRRSTAVVSVSAPPTMAPDRIENFEDFVKVHALLLQASGLPPSLHSQLFQKLYSETFDSGDFFQVQPCEEGRQRRLVLNSDCMEKESHVFLIDHAWTFRLSDAPKQVSICPKTTGTSNF